MANTDKSQKAESAAADKTAPKTSRLEYEYLLAIAERALPMYRELGVPDDKLTITMDLEFAHQSIPIDLAALRDADDSTFAHDVFGIRKHMNRRTRKLEGCFLPRTSLDQSEGSGQ